MQPIHLQRVGEPPCAPGPRVLVDRLWPRGVRREDADWDLWLRDAAPSKELRNWYGHDPERTAEFARRYLAEFGDGAHAAALVELRALHAEGPLTLLTYTREIGRSHLPVLRDAVATP